MIPVQVVDVLQFRTVRLETDRECVQRFACGLLSDGSDDRRIQPAAEHHPHRHIAHHLALDRAGDDRACLVDRLAP